MKVVYNSNEFREITYKYNTPESRIIISLAYKQSINLRLAKTLPINLAFKYQTIKRLKAKRFYNLREL